MSEIADLLERFRRGPELLAVATTGAAGPELDFKPENKWSVRQIVCHLADAETAAAMRLRQLIAEDHPTLVAWDQNAWAVKLDYEKRRISEALEMFRVVRHSNFDVIKDLSEEAFARTGTHTRRGEMSLLDFTRLCAEHVENHVKQIAEARATYKAHRSQK
jgi:DinB superfamily